MIYDLRFTIVRGVREFPGAPAPAGVRRGR